MQANGLNEQSALPDREQRAWIQAQRPPRNRVDPFKPHAFFLEEELAASGRVVSSGTILLTNKECPWRCLMCDLWKTTLTQTVPSGAIPQQIEFALAQLGGRPEQVKLYNSGSFFDPAAIPLADYPDIARKVSFAKHVVVESHPRLVAEKALRLRDLLAGSLEVAMGLETIHPKVLPRLNKKFDLEHFSNAAQFLKKEGIAMRAFVLVKPPFLNDEEGIEWAAKSAAFAFECGAAVVSLIPTRGGNGAMERLRDAGEFAPPRLATLERALELTLNQNSEMGTGSTRVPRVSPGVAPELSSHQSNRWAGEEIFVERSFQRDAENHTPEACAPPVATGRVFADTWDLEKFSNCSVCLAKRQQRLHAMNLSQKILPRIECRTCGGA